MYKILDDLSALRSGYILGVRPLNISVAFVELTGAARQGRQQMYGRSVLIARIRSDDSIHGAGARLAICVTGVAGVTARDGGARDHLAQSDLLYLRGARWTKQI